MEKTTVAASRVFIGVPTYDGKIGIRTAEILYGRSTRRPSAVVTMACSALCMGFNRLWCNSVNQRDKGITHFAMLHADIEPAPGWVDTLIGELEAHNADIVSAVVPLKGTDGTTSTAITGTDKYRPRRLMMRELASLPESFVASDVPWSNGGTLLVNTGCWVCRFTEPWVERASFSTQDSVERMPDGTYSPRFISEDWNFSMFAHGEGLKVMATKKVRLEHVGHAAYPNYGEWGNTTGTW